jgi:hypothetical protein
MVLEETRQKVEDAINAVSGEADRLCGLDPIDPAAIQLKETPS